MLNIFIKSRSFNLLIAITVAVLTTGFLRLQLFSGLPGSDGGNYTFAAQFIYDALHNGNNGSLGGMPIYVYQLMTSWVYGLEVNQFILLRLIDGLVAVAASIVLFKVILKESGSTLFTVILMTSLLIIMNDLEVIRYGFRNSIWAAFLPLFSALLIWQNSTQEDKYSFYLIGALVSFGVLLREPFLVFFILVGIAILIGYGWRILLKYLIGSAVLGFTLLGFILMLRGWDILDLVNSYTILSAALEKQVWQFPWRVILSANWFIIVTAFISIIYLIKLYWGDKKLVNMNRLYFWLALSLVPLIEYELKLGTPYHVANCLIGLAGLSAMGWKYISIQESKKINLIAIGVIGLMSLMILLPTLNKQIVQNNRFFSPVDAVDWVMDPNSLRSGNMIERSQYLKVAAKVYGLSREDSTLVVSGFWQGIYPLTELHPPKDPITGKRNYRFGSLRAWYVSTNYNQDKMVRLIKKYRPTIIVASGMMSSGKSTWRGEEDMLEIIKKTNLYEVVAEVKHQFSYDDFFITHVAQKNNPGADEAGFMSATIYRLKDF